LFDALRNLDAWRRGCRLSVSVLALLDGCANRTFKDQLARSSLSVASNVAEGYAREGTKDRIRLLVIAKGSCTECWTQLLIGAEAGLVDRDMALELAKEAEEIAAMIAGLINFFQRHAGQSAA
jgi:four helix bundle protein